jgi:hypothetical protein
LTALLINPQAAASPGSLNFGSQKVNTSSSALKNTGTTTLTITNVEVTGNAADFPFSNGYTGSQTAGASCTVSVTFTPTAKKPRSATLKFTDNAPSLTQSVALSGTGK